MTARLISLDGQQKYGHLDDKYDKYLIDRIEVWREISNHMNRSTIIYARSLDGHPESVTLRVNELRDIAAHRGWKVDVAYTDLGDVDAHRRPGFDVLVKRLNGGTVGMVMMPSIQHIAISLDALVTFVAELAACGVGLYLLAEQIDTGTPEGTAWMATLLTLEAHRKTIRVERARVGRLRAMAAGVRFGRPPISDVKLCAVRTALQSGIGIRPTSRMTGVSPAKVLMVQRQLTSSLVQAATTLP